jgi:hypothetical protein
MFLSAELWDEKSLVQLVVTPPPPMYCSTRIARTAKSPGQNGAVAGLYMETFDPSLIENPEERSVTDDGTS